MKWHIGLGILSVLLSGVLFGQLSDNAYAATIYDDVIQVETDQTIFHEDYNNGEPVSISDIFSIIRDADNATCNETTYNLSLIHI